MIRFAIVRLRTESKEVFEHLIKEWSSETKEARRIVDDLNAYKANLQT